MSSTNSPSHPLISSIPKKLDILVDLKAYTPANCFSVIPSTPLWSFRFPNQCISYKCSWLSLPSSIFHLPLALFSHLDCKINTLTSSSPPLWSPIMADVVPILGWPCRSQSLFFLHKESNHWDDISWCHLLRIALLPSLLALTIRAKLEILVPTTYFPTFFLFAHPRHDF